MQSPLRLQISSPDLDERRARWKALYCEYLPALAQAKDPVQKQWPVRLDHCFARIILDNAVGGDRPWTEVVSQPAVNNMTAAQFDAALELGGRLVTGETDLVALNERSLQLRGKKRKAAGDGAQREERPVKRKRSQGAAISSYFQISPTSPKSTAQKKQTSNEVDDAASDIEEVAMQTQLRRIEASDITAFRKQTLRLLCQIPRGRYSTYQAISDHVTHTSHKTCARAVGNAMRNNPFAPEVPCHRVLAADGTLGGFKGHWGEEGKFASLKHELLEKEGVRFDSRGKVKGPPFREFATS